MPPAGHVPWAEVGGGNIFVTSWGDCWAAQKTASCLDGSKNSFFNRKPHKLASAGLPSLHGYDARMVYWDKWALRRKHGETSFSPSWVFLFSRNSRVVLGLDSLASLDWEGQTPWASLPFSTFWS